MFKSSKWRKERIKAVFVMQFQATQVPDMKAKSLMISLVPEDSRRTSVKLGRAAIVEGTCSWDSPICETIKLHRDPKSGMLKETIYYFVVSTTSSKSGFLGEVGVDFAKLVETTDPLVLSLPLMPSDCGVILHVTVQSMQGNRNQRSKEGDESIMAYDQCSEQELENGNGYRNSSQLLSPEPLQYSKTTHDFELKKLERHYHWLSSTDCSLGYTSDGSIIDVNQTGTQADDTKSEIESLGEQIVKEIRKETQEQKLQFSNSSRKEMENLRAEFKEAKRELEQERQLKDKLKLKLQETEDSNSALIIAIKDLNRKLEQKDEEICYLQNKLDRLSSDYAVLKAENEDMVKQEEKFKLRVKGLEDEIQRQSEKYLETLETMNELETEITCLENEARAFKDHLETVSRSKVESEKRAIEAEEGITRLSSEMVTKIYEKEKLANNARAEANALLWHNKVLEESLEKAKQELKLTKDHYERELHQRLSEESSKMQTLEEENEKIREALQSEIENRDMIKLENDNLKKQMHDMVNERAVQTCDHAEVTTDVASLRQKNKHMECELKEMEDRYSKMSLKFAEVESERQQLVMVLRNLKNRNNSSL